MKEFYKSRQEIAQELGICVKTLNKYLLNAGLIIPRGLIDPKTQRRIYESIGLNEKRDFNEFRKIKN